MAEEALACFQSLLKSVPVWIADLEDVLGTATQKQNDLLFTHQPAQLESDERPLLRTASKSSSLLSKPSQLQDAATKEEEETQRSAEPTLLKSQLAHMTNSDALRLAQRKRKTTSACSRGQSGPSKFRSRNMVVIYYDGDVQKRFETLVRALGTFRNCIRKGKMNFRVDNLVRSGSSSSESSNSVTGETIKGLGTFKYKSTRTRRHESPLFGSKDGSEAFDNVDGLLEKSQALVERAAHQILRDGDCALEVSKAKEHLIEAKDSAEKVLPKLEKKASKAAARHRRSEEKQRTDMETQSKFGSAKVGREKVEMMPFFPPEGQLEVDSAEAESDSDDGSEFDLSTMQLPPSLNKISMRASPHMLAPSIPPPISDTRQQ